jgi:hypothetical protein
MLKKKWAVLVYMAADVHSKPMRDAAKRNLQQMADAGSGAEVHVAAQIDLKDRPMRRYVFRKKGVPPEQHKYDNINSADPRSIQQFVRWATTRCPAKNTLMIFWGHGFGLDDFSTAHLPNVKEFQFLAPKKVIKRGPAPRPPHEHKYALLSDETSNAGLTNEQLADALALALPDTLSILGLDCCLMAMAEVWSAMGALSKLCVGSQAGEPFSSWPYHLILPPLVDDPNMKPRDVAELIVDKYAEYYETAHGDPLVTLSVSDLSKLRLDSLLSSVQPLAEALRTSTYNASRREKIFAARNLCPIYDDDGYIDLDCFCAFLEMNLPNTNVSQACNGVRDALKKFVAYSRFAPYESNKKISLSKGLSVWFPGWIQDRQFNYSEKPQSVKYLANGYCETNFAQISGWDRFLKSMNRAVNPPKHGG